MIDRLRRRFAIGRVCVVADRGMISAATMAALEERGLAKRRRYIVCRNEAEAKKDAADRRAVVAALEEQLKRGDKALIGNSGYRRYLRRTGKSAFVATAAKAGFETTLKASSAGPYFAVQALDGSGNVLGTSATVKA